MKAKKFERARRAKAETADDRANIVKCSGIIPDFSDNRFDRLQDRIRAAGEIIRMAFFAGAEPSGSSGIATREKFYVFELGFAGLAGGQTVNPRGEDTGEKTSIPDGISRQDSRIHLGRRETKLPGRCIHRLRLGRF